MPIDAEAATKLADLPQVRVLDAAHAQEHSLEVHLPFLQEVLNEFSLVPLVVGDAAPAEVGEVLERLWGGPETIIVISSDLSHYHDYATAQKRDRATSRAIEALRYEDIGYEDACGRNPVNGLLYVARQRGLHVHTVDLRNSGDAPPARAIGWWAMAPTSSNNVTGCTPAQKQQLLDLARTAIQKSYRASLSRCGPGIIRRHCEPRATFVTLHVDAQLHGWIGTIEARRSLVEDVAHNARAAAFEDPRFPALTAPEFERLQIHISVLGVPEPMQFGDSEEGFLRQSRPHVDGLILEAGLHRGTFLPSVWDELPAPHDFLCHHQTQSQPAGGLLVARSACPGATRSSPFLESFKTRPYPVSPRD